MNEKQKAKLLRALQSRFEKNTKRHKGLAWEKILGRLEANPKKLRALFAMEETGGEPDVIGYGKKTGEYIFADCSAESPPGRRSLCYDNAALEERKEAKPKASALNMAAEMGVEILSEEQYRELQSLDTFDMKTSSWLKTPPETRALGGAIFGDRRYNRVFVYHNGASSYYAARGFRVLLKV